MAVQTKAMVFIAVVVVIAAALALAASYNTPPFQRASTSTIQTCTDIPAISFLYCGSPLRITAYGELGASPFGNWTYKGSWNFTVSINTNSVARGEPILLMASLTNIGPNQTIKEFVKPYINPAVHDANGTEVWAWNPPQSTWPNVAIASGETIMQDVSIPTSQLRAGDLCSIMVTPLPIQFPSPNNMTFTFQFSVH